MTDEPTWLEYDDVIQLHLDQIAEFGGLQGVKDGGAVESTLARPKNLMTYNGVTNLFRLAASYSYGFARNHCFQDGNKRVAHMSAFTFLYDNGFQLIPGPAVGPSLFEGLAEGEVTENELAEVLEANCVRLPE